MLRQYTYTVIFESECDPAAVRSVAFEVLGELAKRCQEFKEEPLSIVSASYDGVVEVPENEGTQLPSPPPPPPS